MPIYHTLGSIPRKRHTAFRKPNGGIYAEELMGHEGFTGTSSLLYHVHPPTTIKSAKRVRDMAFEADDDQTLRHRHFRTAQAKAGGSPTLDRLPLMFNQDIAMLYSEPDKADEHFYRNAQADECVYVAKGSGVLESVYGELPFHEGDYVVIHRGILHRYRFDKAKEPPKLLIFESRGHIRWPKRYRNEFGQLKEGAPYSERDIRRPLELHTHDEMGDFTILVKQYDWLTEMVLDHHPFDVVGWDGYFYPWAFNINDFEPIVGRIHQPPPVHQTFEGDGFVICSFCPRPVRLRSERHPGAVQPHQRRFGRSAVLRVERVHEPQGNRVRLHHASSRRHPAWSASGPRRGVHRGAADRRTRGDDGFVPAAEGLRRGEEDRGRLISQVMGGLAARRIQSADHLK